MQNMLKKKKKASSLLLCKKEFSFQEKNATHSLQRSCIRNHTEIQHTESILILLSAVSTKLWLQNSKKKTRLYTIYEHPKRFIIKHNRTK